MLLQSQAPMMKISSFFICLVLTINANTDVIVEGNEKDTAVDSSVDNNGEFFNLLITVSQNSAGIEAGSTPSLNCTIGGPGEVWWTKDDANITSLVKTELSSTMEIKMASRNDTGNYTCLAKSSLDEKIYNKTIFIRVIEPGRISGGQGARVKLNEAANLSCHVEGDPLTDFTWIKTSDPGSVKHLADLSSTERLNDTFVIMSLNFSSATRKDNGTYECRANDIANTISDYRSLIVTEIPQVMINFAKAVGVDSIYLNWTTYDWNDPVKIYYIKYMANGEELWTHFSEKIGGGNSSYIIKGLKKNTTYKFRIQALNSMGPSHESTYPIPVTTLNADPTFIPNITVKGATVNWITIGWPAPPVELQDHVQWYKMMATTDGMEPREAYHPATPGPLSTSYVFMDLKPGTEYKLKVAACSEYTKECGEWSEEKLTYTIDGVASPPRNLAVTCHFDYATSKSVVSVNWSAPEKPNGLIIRYDIKLTGVAQFRLETGQPVVDRSYATEKRVDGKLHNVEFDQVPFNTNYTVSVSGIGRTRTSSGKEATGNCTMPSTVPSRDNLNSRKTWQKIASQGRNLFKLTLPRISERNGPICCYRIFLVKLAYSKTVGDLTNPEESSVYTYRHVTESTSGGAYLAEMYDSDQLATEIFLGDGVAFNGSSACHRCVGLRPRALPPSLNLIPEVQSTAITTAAGTGNDVTNPTSLPLPSTESPENSASRRRREDVSRGGLTVGETEMKPYPPEDGFLDETANYTAFIEVMVYGSEPGQFYAAYSKYMDRQFAGFDFLDIEAAESTSLGIMMQVSIALLIILLVVLMGMCVLHKYLKNAREGGEEIISLRNSFRTLRGRHQLVASNPPDIPPIARSELLQAYIDRHKDSDYGFQHEFEMLPDRFADRTTRASESRENLYKNRYPDIKCYDQTRVRLVQIDGICGSDYINANFVLGYKERKKFICAQGPMENTVCDYWRMIWEQHLELVLMLTNLEEYSKTKCAKYWPDKSESKSFGDITVEHVRERPYSDYVVRELKMTRTGERDSRIIIQHHFLVWKDFMAPEHPHAILRFIKRVNEAYSLEKGPILVHCSAGVGRTGTLVALDSLLQQLAEEGHVSIFNTVCDLRHQRNFLVQSLKQYIFVYRALMEMAQFGDTELSAAQLKTEVEKLRQRENGRDKSKMEEEYEKISSVLEDRKSFSVGGGDENRIKNRNELVIPYDRNRVILTPVPGREHSTYINASFIEGYDNSESFVITQDPLETTIPDFWRMISEQCASTIVMLSDLSEGPRKCPRYWPDDEITYDHIRVRYIQSESCPYYTRRELCVLNTKTDESIVVTQYHYHGWPTVEGEVPEVTRGLIELVDQTISNDVESGGPLVVHCNCGSDRSSMFVALSILVQQLRTERRVDIFTTTKKLRSQRHGMIGTFAQYEFLHRAIVNYSDLHNLADEEPAS
ncbi:tyrosine-protein phosphatase 69D isoform X2 [Athalia rosae]|uniref:tyrosine-protein phosphatase 69D isoform X2 n=1 Tax=Athalia rosae TaxID=37344 RepID=UPI00203379F9|nr:tyrosine-protein phosphatase 69D isoform X2 [Athalia rosae]